MLDFPRKYNPKHLYELFMRNNKNSFSTLSNVNFLNHFKSLVKISANDNYSYVSPEVNLSAVYEELNEGISLDEISKVIAKLKPNKSCGEDYIKTRYSSNVKRLYYLYYILCLTIFLCVVTLLMHSPRPLLCHY